MKLKLIISGGQTGADRTGLECARALAIGTGGWAPRGYRTESGPDPSLKDFGLKETFSDGYKDRTRRNAKESDITVWFGNIGSPGYWCTFHGCHDYDKTLIDNPTPEAFLDICLNHEVVNIAGNRLSTNPSVVDLVKTAFSSLKSQHGHERTDQAVSDGHDRADQDCGG